MISSFKIYTSLLILLAIIGLKEGTSFKGTRMIASDCTNIATGIIVGDIPTKLAPITSEKESVELKHYRFKNSIWSKILSAHDFEQFDENEYFRLLEIYKDIKSPEKDLLEMTPKSIEQKLALIESIQLKFTLFQGLPSVQDEIQNLNTYKLKSLQKLIKKFDLSNKITRENLEEFSSDFFLILRGPPVSLLDYFAKNKTARMNERMLRVLQEDMLSLGLKGELERIPLGEPGGQIQKAREYIQKVMKYKAWRFMVMPYDLPFVDKVKISDELLEKILMDGLNNHQSELIMELKKQDLLDHYERFRKVYRPLAFGVGFYYYYEKYQKKIVKIQDENEEKSNELAKKKFMDDFQKLSNALSGKDPKAKTEDEIREIQFQRVLKLFRDRYQQDPSELEYNELRKKIFDPN